MPLDIYVVHKTCVHRREVSIACCREKCSYSRRVQAVLFGFSLICSRGGGGSTAAAVTLDTVADESRKKIADGVARSPSRLCSRDGKICYGDALSTILLLLCLATYFSFFVFLFFLFLSFPASRYVYFLRVPSSVQQPSATLSKYVFYSTWYVLFLLVVSFVPYPISEFFCFLLVD